MNDRTMTPPKREGYHHGDLRRDLLRAACDEIAKRGAQSVTMASLARLAGVSQPAPYRHFADRDALLEAVAAQGFENFVIELRIAMDGASISNASAAMALAYVEFGERNIELYRLMFASGLTPQAKPESELDLAAGQAFQLLRTSIAASSTRAESDEEVYTTWAQLHGLVMLKADGFIKSQLRNFIPQTHQQ